jgi:predicted HTH transcriptional regulator
MHDSTNELKKQLLPGEDSTFEVKEIDYKGNTVSSPHRNAMADELAAMANTNGGVVIRYDEQPVGGADLSVLNRDLWERFKTPLSPLDDLEFLTKLKLASYDDDGVARPTISGLLMACEKPEAFIPNAYIQAVCYHGEQRNAEQLDAQDITGPLDIQIKNAWTRAERAFLSF